MAPTKRKTPGISMTYHQPPQQHDLVRNLRYNTTNTQHGRFTARVSGNRSSNASLGSQKDGSPSLGAIHTEDSNMNSLFAPPDSIANDFCESSQVFMETFDLPVDDGYRRHLTETKKDNRGPRLRAEGDEALDEWKNHFNLALQEIITLEGRGFFHNDFCATCGARPAEYECVCCNSRLLSCQECIVHDHRRLFLHRIQKWNGKFFERTTLANLGLRVQLGHPLGQICHSPIPASKAGFSVISLNGINKVNLDFCGCGSGNQIPVVQLLRARIFPATFSSPQTGTTFEVLRFFEMLSYQSKVTGFEFYHSLGRLTDNTGTMEVPDKYPSFLRTIHIWTQMHMFKRSGRGHDPLGIEATKEGECAVLCAACPHPGVNMKPNWEKESPNTAFIHAQFVALDANFRLKRKNKSSVAADPGLSKGYGYFVEDTKYRAYLRTHQDEKDSKSGCSRHEAVNMANAKHGKGYPVSGTASVECARHNMKRPNSVGDLQFGERYCNMDYLFYQSLTKEANLKTYNISYDISCQWSINLDERMKKFDEDFFLSQNNPDIRVRFLVPKFHLPAHIASCQTKFSFNWTPGVGRTDGEAVERGWAEVNALAPSTREMGPGMRHDTLDYHFGDYNWRKTTNLASTMHRKFLAAATDMADYTITHKQLTSTLDAQDFQDWSAQVLKWEADPTAPNPFEVTENTQGPTLASVRRQIAVDEAKAISDGLDFSLDSAVTPGVLISSGLDLELQQRNLTRESGELWEHAQDRQHTRYQLHVNTLKRKLEAWAKYQLLYFPAAAALREKWILDNQNHADSPQQWPLFLPSSIGANVPLDSKLREIEHQLREGQANEALTVIRNQVRLRAYLWAHKKMFVRGQVSNTRSRSTLTVVENRIQSAAQDYRVARSGLEALAKLNPLSYPFRSHLYQALHDNDIRAMTEASDGVSIGHDKISWIWRSGQSLLELDSEHRSHYNDQLRLEWVKSRARAHRFTEEVHLLREEMERIVRYFQFRANNWTLKAKVDDERWSDDMLGDRPGHVWKEGHAAYAHRQAAMYKKMADHCLMEWEALPNHLGRMLKIIENPQLETQADYSGPGVE